MSGGRVCRCPESQKPVDERAWEVWQRNCNHSAFSGYHYQPSDYSDVRCRECGAVWRTKAAYVNRLPDGRRR